MMEGVLSQSQEVLKQFYSGLSDADQVLVTLEAKTVILKNPAVWLAGYRNPDQNNDQEEEEDNLETIVGQQGEDQDTPHDDGGVNNEEQENVSANTLPHNSSASSKMVKLKGLWYQKKKKRLVKLLEALEVDSPENHSEHLKDQATMLQNMLKAINIDSIIPLCEVEPDFFSIFGETEDCMMDWKISTEASIEDLWIRGSRQVSDRRATTQSGFKKLSYPSFNGDSLNYLEFKKRWNNEVLPERIPDALELAAL